jgi:glycosyltransferase involved in cell wall biosynthesis
MQPTNPALDIRRPRFSAIMPVFNAAATLEASMASVLAQTEQDFELIAVDDGSTDNSLNILREAARRDRRVRVLPCSNRGVSAARNRGIMISHGRLIAFLDSDDLWAPDKLARHGAAHARDPLLAMSYARVAFIAPEAANLSARVISEVDPKALQSDRILAENPACTASNIVVRREALIDLGVFAEDLRYAEDHELLVRTHFADRRIGGIDAVLVGYRLSPSGLSLRLDDMLAGWRAFAGRYADRAQLARAEAIYRRYLARRALRGGCGALTPLRFALTGVARHAGAFLGDRRRGLLTLGGALVNPFLTAPLRAAIFA